MLRSSFAKEFYNISNGSIMEEEQKGFKSREEALGKRRRLHVLRSSINEKTKIV